MREDQRGIQFHPAAVPLVSISLSFLAYFPFSLFFLAILAPVSRAFLFFFSSHPFFFVFFRLPRRVSSNFHDYSRRRVFLCIFPPFLSRGRLSTTRRLSIDSHHSMHVLRAFYYCVYLEERDFVMRFPLFIALVCVHYSFINS